MIRCRFIQCCVLLAAAAAHIGHAETVLRVVPGADLGSLDPMGPAATQTYIHGMMVYDTLFALDARLQVHPQMLETDAVSPDRLNHTMRLRPGLLFHDGSPVTSKDVIASMKRWMTLDIVGRTMAADETARIRLKKAGGTCS